MLHLRKALCRRLPAGALRGFSPRDLLRLDNVAMQRSHYLRRGDMERAGLSITRHIFGRTHWDAAAARMLAPQAEYHYCGETLRKCFYSGQWQYDLCQKHSIFASGPDTPIKGFHHLLEALKLVLQQYPDTVISVPGPDIFRPQGRQKLLEQTYHRYLRRYAGKKRPDGSRPFSGMPECRANEAGIFECQCFCASFRYGKLPQCSRRGYAAGTPLHCSGCRRRFLHAPCAGGRAAVSVLSPLCSGPRHLPGLRHGSQAAAMVQRPEKGAKDPLPGKQPSCPSGRLCRAWPPTKNRIAP